MIRLTNESNVLHYQSEVLTRSTSTSEIQYYFNHNFGKRVQLIRMFTGNVGNDPETQFRSFEDQQQSSNGSVTGWRELTNSSDINTIRVGTRRISSSPSDSAFYFECFAF